MRDLIDPEDGENRAIRAFLMHYGAPGLTVMQMRKNMAMAGWDGCWPAWVYDQDGHLTKGGAQNWLRHLFALEATATAEAQEDWMIDRSTGRPILTYKKCSVIEAEQAEYVMRLVAATSGVLVRPTEEPGP
jgi:hypothetical protein